MEFDSALVGDAGVNARSVRCLVAGA